MHLTYNLLLFIITFVGGSIPLWFKGLDDRRMHYLLAFSGSFLLSITFLHLLPETFTELGPSAGFYLLVGFFLQLLIQRITHGIEHGHVHIHSHGHDHHIPLTSIIVGLSIHAFMEGLPLGFNYRMEATEPSLYLAVAAHKLPEAILLCTLLATSKGKTQSIIILLIFSLLTPFASLIASRLGQAYYAMSQVVTVLIPIVAGAFIHIATTIFFESGTKQHMLTWQKIVAMVIGVGIGLATLVLE
jgi:zinc and cadmium transporter